MHLALIRLECADQYTIGRLFLDGKVLCYTLEDAVREVSGESVETWKIPGCTAIPRGLYAVDRNFSPRFSKYMPQVLGVPGFEGVRIHAGNTTEDTEGCILVGAQRGIGRVGQSRIAYEVVDGLIAAAQARFEKVWLEVV